MNLGALRGSAISIAALTLVLAGCGGEGSSGSSAGEQTAASKPAVTVGAAETPSQPSEEQSPRKRPRQDRTAEKPEPVEGRRSEKRSTPAQKPKAGQHEKDAGGRAHQARPGDCPAGVPAGECEEAAEALAAGNDSGATNGKECPPGISAAECREAAAAVKAGAGGGGSDAAACPAGVSPSDCQAIAEALRE